MDKEQWPKMNEKLTRAAIDLRNARDVLITLSAASSVIGSSKLLDKIDYILAKVRQALDYIESIEA